MLKELDRELSSVVIAVKIQVRTWHHLQSGSNLVTAVRTLSRWMEHDAQTKHEANYLRVQVTKLMIRKLSMS